MVSHPREDRVGYEPGLRVIGRRLDTEPSYHARVLEVPDGFAVRWQPVRHRTNERVVMFDWQRLRNLGVFHSAARLLDRNKRHSGLWANFPNGHEDFFRALGHKLDHEHATNLSVDEVPDGLSVSYLRPAQQDAFALEKCHLMYGINEVAELIGEAQERRGEGIKFDSA